MALALVGWLLGATSGFPAMRTFTDTSGRAITAEIMDATETTVRVRRDDGRVFELALHTLSEGDRSYVSDWHTEQAFAFGSIEVTAQRVRLDSDRTQTRSSTKKTEDWCYKLTIANRSRADLNGLTIDYRIFFVTDTPKADRDELPLKRQSGRATINTLAADAKAEIQSTIVTLQVIQMKPGHRSSGTSKRRVEDSLAGVWVRVMRGGELMHEFADPTTLIRSEPW